MCVHPRPHQREPQEAPDRPPPRLGARLPLRGLRPAQPVRQGRSHAWTSSASATTSGFTSVMGEPWPGVREAERRLDREAADRGTTVAEVRKERQDRFDTLAGRADEGSGAGRGRARLGAKRRSEDARCGPQSNRRIERWPRTKITCGRSPTRARTASRTWSRPGPSPSGLDVGTSKVVASRRERQGDRSRATQLNAFIPVPVVALHREDHPGPDRHRLLSRRRRDRHLRVRHRALRQHVQRRGPPAHGRRPLEPPREAGLAGAGGDPPDPRAEGARRRARSWPSRSPRPSWARNRSSSTTRPPSAGISSPSATARWRSTRAWPSSSRSSKTRTSPASASPAAAGCATPPSPTCRSPRSCSPSRRAETSSTVGGSGGGRARDAGEGHEGGGQPRPLAPPRTSSRRRCTSTTRTSRSRSWTGCGARSPPRRSCRGRIVRCPSSSPGAPRSREGFRDLFERTLALAVAAHRDRRGPHGLRPPDRHRARGPDRRDVREVGRWPRRPRAPTGPVAPRPVGPSVSRPRRRSSSSPPSPPGPSASGTSTTWRPATRSLAGRCPEALKNLQEAVKLKPGPALNEQTYGLQFVDYTPYYWMGVCYLKAGRRRARPGDVQEGGRPGRHQEVGPLQGPGQAPRRCREPPEPAHHPGGPPGDPAPAAGERGARREAKPFRGPGQARPGRGAREGPRSGYPAGGDGCPRSGSGPRESEIQEAAKKGQDASSSGSARRSACSRKARPRRPRSAFDDVLALDAQNTRALEGKKAAQERIRASTTRAKQAAAFQQGKSLFEAGQYEAALEPLTARHRRPREPAGPGPAGAGPQGRPGDAARRRSIRRRSTS